MTRNEGVEKSQHFSIQKQNLLGKERGSGRRCERRGEERGAGGRPWSKTCRTREKSQRLGLGTLHLQLSKAALGISTTSLQLTTPRTMFF